MKIGVVTDFYYPWIGGPSAVVRNLGAGFATRGHAVYVLAPGPDGHPVRETDGSIDVQRARTASLPFGYNLRVACTPLRDARLLLDRVQPDVVHVHHPFPLSAAAIHAARRRGIPVVATNHTIPECSLWGLRNHGSLYSIAYFCMTRWLLYLLDSTTLVATPTATAAGMLRTMGFKRNVVAISNGIDTNRFSPGPKNESLRARLGLDDRPVVLYTGRLDAEKQMDVWLRAASTVAAGLNIQFVVGGRGAEQEALRRLAIELELSDNVSFVGYVSESDLSDLYRLADVYFVTSPVELQSIATLEAIATGLPVVATRAGALPELVHHGQNGFLVPVGDASAAADCLAQLLENERLRSRFGFESRRIAMDHDLLGSVERYERLLTAALKTPRGERGVEQAAAPGR